MTSTNFSKIATAFSLFFAISIGSLSADTLRVNVGFWPGERESELEQHFFMDDLLWGTQGGVSIGFFNLPWVNTNTMTVPLGLEYRTKTGIGKLVIGADYHKYSPDYKWNAIHIGRGGFGAIQAAQLDSYLSTDLDGYIGYEIPLADNKVFITPKFGMRRHTQSFELNRLTIGDSTIGTTINAPFESSAIGGIAGVGAQIYLAPKVSLIGEYMMSAPFLGSVTGDMSFDLFEVTIVGNRIGRLEYTTATAGVEMDIIRTMLGVQFDATNNISLQAGIRNEKVTTAYNDYFALPIIIEGNQVSGGGMVMEYLLDYLTWTKGETTDKGMVFFNLSYDINW